MAENSQELSSKLARTRRNLEIAQARVAELEARLLDEQPKHATLLANKDCYHRTLDNMMEGCQIIGFDWHYIYLNDTAARHAQRSKHELLGSAMLEQYPGIEKTELFVVLQRCMQERRVERMENQFVYPDGTTAWFELRIRPVPEGIFVLSLDITERKQAAEALRESAEWIRLALNASNLGMWQHDIETGVIRFDEQARIHYGFATDTVTLDMVLNQIHPEDVNRLAAEIASTIDPASDGRYVTEYRVIHPDGSVHWLAIQARVYFEGETAARHPHFGFGTSQDITDRKEAEKVEHEQRVLAEALRDSLAALTASPDVETVLQQILAYSATVIPSESGAIILFEENQVRVPYLRGYSPEAETFFKNNLFTFETGMFTKGDDKQGYYLVADTRSDPAWEPFPYTEWIRSSIGVQIRLQDKPIGLIVADSATPDRFQQKDVTNLQTFARYAALALENAYYVDQLEQRVNERTTELQAATERVEAILNNSVDGILLVHSDFTIQQANPAFDQLFACETNIYLGEPLSGLFDAEDADQIIKTIQEALKNEQAVQLEVCAQRHDGTFFNAEFSIGFIKQDGFVCSIRDITERKQAEEALQKSTAEIHDLYNNAPCGYHSIDKNGVIVQINDTELRWMGYSRDEVVNKLKITDLFTPESVQNFEKNFPLFKERGWINDLEFDFISKDGRIIHILLNGTAIYDFDGEYLMSRTSLFDITELQQAQQALVESELRYRLLAENVTDIIAKMSPEGIRTFVTPSCYALLGFTPEELIGVPALEIVHPDDRLQTQATMMQAINASDSSFLLTQRVCHKDGHYIWIELKASIIRDPVTGKPLEILGVIRDITERKWIAAELEEQRTFLRNVIDVSPNMIFVKDYNAHFVLANPMVAKMYNTTVEALIGKTDADFNPSPQEVEDFLKADQRVIDSGEPLFIEEPITNFAGETHWLQTIKVPIISVDGKSRYVLGVSADITERKRAEADLKESEEKYRLLVETMRGGLAIYDADDRIIYINDRFCELMGYTRAELVGTRSFDYVDTTNAETISRHLEHRRQAESTSYELVVRHKDGQPIYILVSGSPLFDKAGNLIGSFAVITDITVQKQAEAALWQAFEKEKELGELKTRFVSMASHEFRTPLATILALTETLRAYRHRLEDDQIDERLDKIKLQIDHLKDIMEDVLLLARMQARRVEYNPAMLDLNALCRSVLDEFQSRDDVKHQINYSCNEENREVALDRKLMRQIISNVVSNALKYSPEDKSVEVRLDYTDSAIILKVQDEGIGIPEADMKHLFEPFHRATNVGTTSGTGLGLVITKESVELHGGTIEVESQLGVGTTLTICIPIATRGATSDGENSGNRR